MRIIIQRVTQAKVEVDSQVTGVIAAGMLVFLGVGQGDDEAAADTLIEKMVLLRIFDDDQGKMNLSALDTKAEFLIVSQFTLYGDCSKGRRPSFDKAADPKSANQLYEYFIEQLKKKGLKVETGRFGAMMDVSLVNDGPVTFFLES